MKNKIKIAIITSNLELNGISSVIMNYCRAIDKKQFEISIFAGKEINDDYRDECNNLGIEIVELPSKRKNKLKYYWNLLIKVKRNKYDIYHVNGNSAIMAIDLLIAYIKGIKVRIAHSHSSTCKNMTIHKLLLPLFKKLYTKAFACSKLAGRWIFNENEFTVIQNGIDIATFKFNIKSRNIIRHKLNVKDDEILVGHIGRINYQKNQEFLINTFEKIAEKNSKVKLLIVGDGPEYQKIKEIVGKSQFSNRVILYGESNNPENFYMAMDIFAFPSKSEGLGIVLIEAQVSGLKCIVSDKVPDDVIITDNIKKIPLEINLWRDEILKYNNTYIDERKYDNISNNQIRNYDLNENVKRLEKIYKEEKDNW